MDMPLIPPGTNAEKSTILKVPQYLVDLEDRAAQTVQSGTFNYES